MTQIDELQRHQMPKGAIIMWSGTNVPSGYALCNGQTVGDITTPDLQGRFIVGKGSLTDSEGNTATYNIGSTGGLNKHKLTAAESGLPQHAHTMVSAGAHSHQLRMGSAGTYHNTVEYAGNDDGYKALGDNNYNFVKSAGSHTHTINNAGGTAASQSHENRPPYYALAYIMKVI